MTVKELKEKLNEFDNDMEVITDDNCGGSFFDISEFKIIEFVGFDLKTIKKLYIS